MVVWLVVEHSFRPSDGPLKMRAKAPFSVISIPHTTYQYCLQEIQSVPQWAFREHGQHLRGGLHSINEYSHTHIFHTQVQRQLSYFDICLSYTHSFGMREWVYGSMGM